MTDPSPLRIAVLGDVHGHLTLALRLLRRWQDETGHELDLILQVGDLGAFPPPFRLDDATRRFADHDPDELGFVEYDEGGPEAAEVFGPDASPARAIAAPFWFIKGNHEDFAFLDDVGRNASEPVPVDAFGAVHPKYAGGSREVAELIHRHRPTLHFCGHLHEPGQLLPSVDGVRSFLLNAVNFLRANRLNPGCIAIVAWSGPGEVEVELLDAPWLREYTRHSWRHR
jgi:hypothetical protein